MSLLFDSLSNCYCDALFTPHHGVTVTLRLENQFLAVSAADYPSDGGLGRDVKPN